MCGKPRVSMCSSQHSAQSRCDEDTEMRPEPISPEKREEVIVHMAAGLLGAYRYFRAHRQSSIRTSHGARFQSRTERPMSVRLREKVQALLRRGDGELTS